MEYTELNPEGNFKAWSHEKLTELQQETLCDNIGTCHFENDTIKVSELVVPPFERMPFKKRKHPYSATCITGGLVISRNGNGQITMLRIKEGDITYWKFRDYEAIADLQNIGPTEIRAIVVEYKCLNSITDKYSINSQ